ncbi:T6SS secretion lipoprotein TssJ (VasD) [Cupriavidus sp. U2]|uniref:type VI secretion system lipoprotein TssJ n=1 Tax=Cupriavidus sp. U2 TaxID=2920269 RepID=UPI00129E5D33|nr:type VI secretion system lipoprotein TssJ [Cupriavidus sp. U2]KAI3589500.1 T6SS secretion lipoprotein TssJ (VasD) [Cupriavidus sp. U2]
MRCLKRSAMVALASAGLVGCGVGQAVKDGTVDAAKWAFTSQVKTMNIDLAGRASVNPDAAGKSLSTVVRFYQLKDAQRFEQSTYEQLQANDLEWLKPDLLATGDVVLRPGAAASISEPMKDGSEYVGVVAFFRDTGGDAVWKLVIPRKQWKKSDPVRIEVRGNTLEMT